MLHVYKNWIQKDTDALLEETLLQSLLFVDDDLNQEKRDVGEISIMAGDEGVIAEEKIYKLCETLAVALPHISTSRQEIIFSVSSKLQSPVFLCGVDMVDSEGDDF